ncbi:MAG: acetylornithine deacetylase [Robiginitomaculum sp.]|nr:acetylornithine deacetylase [Robiginitomaculum sp.]
MQQVLCDILDRLETLVACDTRNPPRDMSSVHPIVGLLAAGFDQTVLRVNDLGEGCVQILLQRGTPSTLINVHVDTVPCAEGWSHSPFELVREETRAFGLGACDIKGAAACAIVAAQAQDRDFALLFTTDEENGKGRCVEAFAASDHGFSKVIVCEPTMSHAIFAHRGLGAYELGFAGSSMHSSEWAALESSGIHRAARWITAACDYAQTARSAGETLPGICLNIGHIEGGIKPNICAPSCDLNFGMRPGPGKSLEEIATELQKLVPAEYFTKFEQTYGSPALDLRGDQLKKAQSLAQTLGISTGDPVNFWTEAALFAEVGLPTFVFGPGNIAQAHSVDEWVSYEQLMIVYSTFTKVFELND